MIMFSKNYLKFFFKDTIIISTLSIFFFLIIDSFLTKVIRVRGFSEFFESDPQVGFINKRDFNGKFGGPLEDFENVISFNSFGTRTVSKNNCKFTKSKVNENLIFVGDSMLAGFEVKDEKHYVSKLSKMCLTNGALVNGGVRAHDTHMASANAVRIMKEFSFNRSESIIIYAASHNDLIENDDPNIYYNMKARFGSIFNNQNYRPYLNPSYLRFRTFIADNFYFTTRLIHTIEKYKRLKSPKTNNNNLKLSKNACMSILNFRKYYLYKTSKS